MNYLAHALLSPRDPMILMGNLWGDLLKPKDYPDLSPKLLRGISRHKAIDEYTDQHAAVEEMAHILRPSQGKYTPVVADVLMDYILSKKWQHYHHRSIEVYCQEVYLIVHDHIDIIPERLHPRINRMMSHRWLESCKDKDRMLHTLQMLSRRASFENNIPYAMEPYEAHMERMDALFDNFFEDISRHINLQNEG